MYFRFLLVFLLRLTWRVVHGSLFNRQQEEIRQL